MHRRQGDAAAPLGSGDQEGSGPHRRDVRRDHGGTRHMHVLGPQSKCDVTEDLAHREDRHHGKTASHREHSDSDRRQQQEYRRTLAGCRSPGRRVCGDAHRTGSAPGEAAAQMRHEPSFGEHEPRVRRYYELSYTGVVSRETSGYPWSS